MPGYFLAVAKAIFYLAFQVSGFLTGLETMGAHNGEGCFRHFSSLWQCDSESPSVEIGLPMTCRSVLKYAGQFNRLFSRLDKEEGVLGIVRYHTFYI